MSIIQSFSSAAVGYHHGDRSLPFTSSYKTNFDESRQDFSGAVSGSQHSDKTLLFASSWINELS
jgi:hypothetical protein